MLLATPKKRRRLMRADIGSYWISFSDMLSSLLLVFILAVTFSIYQYYSLLEIKTRELQTQKAQLDRAQITLVQKEKDLQTAQVELMGKEEQLASIQIQLDQQQNDLHAAQTALKTKEEEQALLQLQLSDQAQQLGDLQLALTTQQQQLDDLLGVRTAIIRELSRALSAASVGAKVDPGSGDIIMDSQLMFQSGSAAMSASGMEQLTKLIPVYLEVLMRPEYKNYVAEIIIEGHTDSKGSYMFNLELSQSRALSVAKYALEMPSLNTEQRALLQKILTAKGRSYSNPITNPDGTENMDASRRVELKFRLKDTEMIQRMNDILSTKPQ